MSKIIIDNRTELDDLIIIQAVERLVSHGKVSGQGEYKQYAYAMSFALDSGFYTMGCTLNRKSKTQTLRITKDTHQ